MIVSGVARKRNPACTSEGVRELALYCCISVRQELYMMDRIVSAAAADLCTCICIVKETLVTPGNRVDSMVLTVL